jgi:hypothetical protein
MSVTSAFGVDGNVYNGSECTFAEPGHYDGQERSNIKLWNQSGGTRTYSCPLTRDLTTSDVEYVYVIVSDTISPSTCHFWEREDDFAYSVWSYDSVEAEAGSYDKIRWFNSTSYAATTNWASYQITCDVPNGAGIYSYYLEEK